MRAAPAPVVRRQRLPNVSVPIETELDDDIKEAIDDSYWDSEGDSSAYHIRHHLAMRGLLIVEADKYGRALVGSQLVESTVASIKQIGA